MIAFNPGSQIKYLFQTSVRIKSSKPIINVWSIINERVRPFTKLPSKQQWLTALRHLYPSDAFQAMEKTFLLISYNSRDAIYSKEITSLTFNSSFHFVTLPQKIHRSNQNKYGCIENHHHKTRPSIWLVKHNTLLYVVGWLGKREIITGSQASCPI